MKQKAAACLEQAADHFQTLQRFAQQLGWRSLKRFQHTIDNGSAVLPGQVITWFESGRATGGRTDLFLQINRSPASANDFFASVYAVRFRIWTGWHSVHLESDDAAKAEAQRLKNWLDRRWFTTLTRRREFRLAHPECVGFTWRRIASEVEPVTAAGRKARR